MADLRLHSTTNPSADLIHRLRRLRAINIIIGTSALAVLTGCICWRTYKSYTRWLLLGRGGLPHNFFGFSLQSILEHVLPYRNRTNKGMRTTDEYEELDVLARYDDRAMVRYLDMSLPVKDERPFVVRTLAPQRQAGSGGNAALRQQLLQAFDRIVAARSDVVCAGDSKLEGGGPAIYLTDTANLPRGTERTVGEVAHIHIDADGSCHCTLSLPDAREVITKRWGQKHMGSGMLLPHGYVMLYAPTCKEDVDIIEQIIEASVGYMSVPKG